MAIGADILAFIAAVLSALESKLTSLITAAKSAATSLFNSAVALVNSLYKSATALATLMVNNLKALTESLVAGAIALTRSLFSSATTTYVNMNAQTEVKFTGLLGAMQSALIALFTPALSGWNTYKNLLSTLNDIFTSGFKTKLLDLVNRLYGFIVAIATNPLGWLFGVMYASFQSFLCFVLAYGFGAVKETLPPLPDWSGGGGGVYPPGTVPPGAGASGLFMPVTPVYVSGYIFAAPHYGVDLGIVANQAVYAMHDGIAEGVGWSTIGYGFKVDIRGSRYWSRYAHLATPLVSDGQEVRAGQLIAYGDSTGNSTGDHLHLEIKIDGLYIDPMTILY